MVLPACAGGFTLRERGKEMFTKEEWLFIAACVDNSRSQDVAGARKKAEVILKVCDVLEEMNEAELKGKGE